MAARANRRVYIVGLSLIQGRRGDWMSLRDQAPADGKQGNAGQPPTQAAGVQDGRLSAAVHNASPPFIAESLAASAVEDKNAVRSCGRSFAGSFVHRISERAIAPGWSPAQSRP